VNVLPSVGEKSGRRWRYLILAAVAGFVGRGELDASPASIIRILFALFVIVFVVTLGFSVLSESGLSEPAADPALSEAQQGNHEAVFGSP
jgi:uncharacterized membrane protein YtjA (UPF0391 family)